MISNESNHSKRSENFDSGKVLPDLLDKGLDVVFLWNCSGEKVCKCRSILFWKRE